MRTIETTGEACECQVVGTDRMGKLKGGGTEMVEVDSTVGM